MKDIKIGVVDDHTLFREGMTELINKQPGMRVVMQAHNGLDIVTKLSSAKRPKPGVLLIDLQMPVMSGIDAIKVIVSRYPGIKIIALTMHDSDQMMQYLLENGAAGFLPKNTEIDILVKAIKEVHERGEYRDDRASSLLLKNSINKRSSADVVASLSPREIAILKLICSEHTVKEIGEILQLSHRTIEAHKLKIQEKVGAKNTVGLVLYALNNNLLTSVV